MKKELSYYEFAGILVPSVIFLYVTNFISGFIYEKQLVDFGKIGETVVFFILAYGFGQLLQGLGNIFEKIYWALWKGMPTKWLSSKNRLGNNLFNDELNSRILINVEQKFGHGLADYGKAVNSYVIQKGSVSRIDIFNSNYSLFRGLSVSFLLISIICFHYFDWTIAVYPMVFFLLAVMRMHRFAVHYASEVFRTFYNLIEKPTE